MISAFYVLSLGKKSTRAWGIGHPPLTPIMIGLKV